MTVVDASAVVELLLGLPLAPAAERQVFEVPGSASAPDHVNAEVLHAVRRYERVGRIDASRALEAVDDLVSLPLSRYPTLSILGRAWAYRSNMTAYDALYVALAEALDAPLLTADRRLGQAARTHTPVEVMLLEEGI